MLALNPQFTILAAFCSLAAVSLAPNFVSAAAIQVRYSADHKAQKVESDTGGYSQKPIQQSRSVLDLPKGVLSRGRMDKVHHHEHGREKFKGDAAHNQGHRRSIVIPNNHGSHYVVSHSRRAPHHRASLFGRRKITVSRREVRSTSGTIAIMSPVDNSTDRKIASLYLDRADNGPYVLNASDKNSTEVYLVNASSNSSDSTSETPVFISMLIEQVEYCATYDPNPPVAEPLTMQPCMNGTDTDEHKSQTFSFDEKNGVVRPMWFSGEDDGKSDAPANSTTAASSEVSSNATTSAGSTNSTATSFSSRDANTPSSSQNVTLVFVPTSQADAADVEASTTSTMTLTTTATVTVTASGSATTSSGMSSATFSSAGHFVVADATASGSSTTLSTLSTLSASDSASPASSSAVQGALNVQVVGADTSSDSQSATATSTTAPATTTASSIDAAAVASSIAASNSAVSSSLSASASSSLSVNAIVASASASSSEANATPSQTVVAISGRRLRRAPAQPKMTPVSTAPYKWMFKAEQR